MAILNKFFQADEEAKKTDEKSVAMPRAKKEVKKEEVAKTPAKTIARRALVRPIITEKSSLLMSQNQYVFEVAPGVNKIMVSHAIKDLYGVTPIRVRMLNVPEKVRVRGRMMGIKQGWKKAIVVLPAGSSIRVSEGGA